MQKAEFGRFLVTVFVLLILGAASSAEAKEASRIELSDGTVYEDVSFRSEGKFRVIYVSLLDGEKTISFTKVVQILDADGYDITGDIIGKLNVKRDATKPEVGAPETSVEAIDSETPTDATDAGTDETWLDPETHKTKYGKLPFGASINLHGCMSFPIGTYYDGIDEGVGFGANLVVPIGRKVALRGTVSKSGLGVDWADLSVWRYLIAGQYYNWPKWRTGGKTIYNFWTGLGAAGHTGSGGFSETKFVTNAGGSIIHMMSEVVGLEFGGNLDVVWAGTVEVDALGPGDDTYEKVQTALILDFRLGIAIML